MAGLLTYFRFERLPENQWQFVQYVPLSPCPQEEGWRRPSLQQRDCCRLSRHSLLITSVELQISEPMHCKGNVKCVKQKIKQNYLADCP